VQPGLWINTAGTRVQYLSQAEQLHGIRQGSVIYAIPPWWKNKEWDYFMSIAVARHFTVLEELDATR